jgi:hypothetical protein
MAGRASGICVLTMSSNLLKIFSLPQPAGLPSGAPGVPNQVECTMRDDRRARPGDLLDLFRIAATGVFPGPILEALIARMEVAP